MNELSPERIAELASQHLKAFAQFIGAGDVWYEGEVEFARAIEREVRASCDARIAALEAENERLNTLLLDMETAKDAALAQLAEVRAGEARDAWIAVADRKPEPMTMVLAAFEMDGPGDWRVKCASYEPDSKEAAVWSQGGWRIFGGVWTPTHWRPLPEPPAAMSRASEAGGGDAQGDRS